MSDSEKNSRKWWMFLPFILVIGGIFYLRYRPKKPQISTGGWIIEPSPYETAETPENQPERPRLSTMEIVLRDSGLWHEEIMLQLLSFRVPEIAALTMRCPGAQELLATYRLIPAELLAARQEFYLRSNSVTLAAQRQILSDDPVMQYAALGILIDREITRLGNRQELTAQELAKLAQLISLQYSLVIDTASAQ